MTVVDRKRPNYLRLPERMRLFLLMPLPSRSNNAQRQQMNLQNRKVAIGICPVSPHTMFLA